MDMALNEARRAHPDLSLLQQFPTGQLYLQSDSRFAKLTAPWRQRQSIYLHHWFPVHVVVPLQSNADDLARLAQAAERFIQPGINVQVRSAINSSFPYTPAHIHQCLTGNPLVYSREAPTGRILSVLITDDAAYMGISSASQNLSPWAVGSSRSTNPSQIARVSSCWRH
jgi:23S rRNA (cytidine2498-2'-O)-methyltransferase